MILFNITFLVEDTVNEQWQSWIPEAFVEPSMRSGLFASAGLLKVLDSPNEGFTYSLQFIADRREQADAYQQRVLPALLETLSDTFPNKCFHFTSVMEFLDQY
jgi:hypothetical protein